MSDKSTHRPLLRRRDFLLLLASLPLLPTTLNAKLASKTIKYSEEPWLTLDTVMEHLFPAIDDTPGARELGVLSYMQTMLSTPDADPQDQTFINQGVGWLNDLSRQKYQQSFTTLNETQRETILRQIETSNAGERWLSLLLTYLLEALVSDPVYGSNPDGIGWNWLQHTPGYPRPTPDTMYYKLGQRVTRNIKA